jgi:hypothetical protein
MIVGDLLKSSMRLIGVLSKGEAPPNDEMQDALQAANMMLDSWSTERLMLVGMTLENFPLQADVASYSIGTGQTFNTVKPLKINDAYLRDSSNLDYPLDIISEEQYNSLEDKDVTISLPQYLFFDRGETEQVGNQSGTIYFYGIPDRVYTVFIDSQKILSELPAITSTFTLEAPYERAIKFNLACEIFYEYYSMKVQIPKWIKDKADETKTNIKTLNHQIQTAVLDLPGKRGRYNILADTYTR